jgi:excisionase family DNA binding protein
MVEQLYTIEEVANLLKVSRKTLYEWMNAGKLSFVLVGDRRRITQSAVNSFIREGTPAGDGGTEGENSEGITIPGLVAA